MPLDGTEESASIVPTVVDFARTHKSRVVLFHDEVGLKEDEFASPNSAAVDLIEKIKSNIEKQGIDVSFETSCNVDPVKEIVNKVGELEVDMVAMATHGRTGLSRFMFGSVVEGFLRIKIDYGLYDYDIVLDPQNEREIVMVDGHYAGETLHRDPETGSLSWSGLVATPARA